MEFFVEEGISDEETLQLIKTEPPKESSTTANNNSQEYQIYEHSSSVRSSSDPFAAYFYASQTLRDKSSKIVLNRDALVRLKPTEVIVCSWPSSTSQLLPSRYFRNFLPDVALKRCKHCNKIFHADDYELHFLQKSRCPYCRCAHSSSSAAAPSGELG